MSIPSKAGDVPSAELPSDQRALLEALFESAAQGVIAINEQGNILLVNAMTERMFGYHRDDLIGKSVETLIPAHLRQGHQHKVNGFVANPRQRAMGLGRELAAMRKDGSEFPVEIALSYAKVPTGTIAMALVTDISERQRKDEERQNLQDQLLQSQKLEALALLTSGVAHDFNNLLSIIGNYTSVAQLRVADDEMLQQCLTNTQMAVDRAAALIRKMLTYSKPTDHRRVELFDVSEAVNDCLDMLQATCPPGITLRRLVDSHCGFAKGDPTQIQQVVMNLGANAFQAIADFGGTVTVEAHQSTLEEYSARSNIGLTDGKYVILVVRDDGPGMPEPVQSQVFDPFFTTKPPGEGTGLGLSVVKGIVESMHGVVDLQSTPGEGTCFTLYLPSIDGTDIEKAGAEDKTAIYGKGHILLVDDEVSIIEGTQMLLEQLGYTVTAFNNGAEAMVAFTADPSKFDAVLTDMTMPRMTGIELTLRIRKLRQDIPILLATGFRGLVDDATVEMMKINHVLLKPCSIHELSSTLQKSLMPKPL